MSPIQPERTLFLQARDGLKLHIAHWPLRGARGVVVFLHGLAAHGGWYGELAAVLRAANWAMVAPDYRGHGLSEGPRAGLSKDDDLLFDVGTVLDHVRETYPDQPLVLMGHSTGGLVASRFGVAEDMQRGASWWRPVEGLVLLAPALQATLSLTQKALLTTMGRLLLDVGMPMGIDLNWVSDNPVHVQESSQDPLMHGRITPRFALFLAREGQRVLDHASTWSTPTLMLYSQADKLVSPEGCERFARRAPTSALTTKVYAHLAHSLLHEPHRDLVHDDITHWLQQHFPQ
jgi:alpha-beta hydrolase superfamily lysophospholipase